MVVKDHFDFGELVELSLDDYGLRDLLLCNSHLMGVLIGED